MRKPVSKSCGEGIRRIDGAQVDGSVPRRPSPCLQPSSLQPAILVLIASPPARRAKRVCKLQSEQRFRTLVYVAVANCSRVTPSLRQSSITVTTLLQHLPCGARQHVPIQSQDKKPAAARDSTYQSNHKTTRRQRDKQLCRQQRSNRRSTSSPTREMVQWRPDTPSSSASTT